MKVYQHFVLAALALLPTAVFSKEATFSSSHLRNARAEDVTEHDDPRTFLMDILLPSASAETIKKIASAICYAAGTDEFPFELEVGDAFYYCNGEAMGLISSAMTGAIAEHVTIGKSKKQEIDSSLEGLPAIAIRLGWWCIRRRCWEYMNSSSLSSPHLAHSSKADVTEGSEKLMETFLPVPSAETVKKLALTLCDTVSMDLDPYEFFIGDISLYCNVEAMGVISGAIAGAIGEHVDLRSKSKQQEVDSSLEPWPIAVRLGWMCVKRQCWNWFDDSKSVE